MHDKSKRLIIYLTIWVINIIANDFIFQLESKTIVFVNICKLTLAFTILYLDDYWIGGTDEFMEGHWLWIPTMQKLSFTDWSPGNPSDSGSNEDCMEIIVGHSAPLTKWNDDNCSNKANFICEVPYVNSWIVVNVKYYPSMHSC